MAIVGFAMVSLLGLVPMGLVNFRQAMNNTIEAQIVENISYQLELTSFSNLAYITPTTYYDADGNLLNSSAGAVYTVTTSFTAVQGSNYPVNLSTNADMVKIQIVNNTQAGTQSGQHQTHVYTFIVANENN